MKAFQIVPSIAEYAEFSGRAYDRMIVTGGADPGDAVQQSARKGETSAEKSILKWLSKDGHFCVNRVSAAGKLMYFLRYGAAWACLRLNNDLWGMTGSSLRKPPVTGHSRLS
ncbi:hypothetical protein D7X33_22535 [Butyricicoccus sp. 1XD8-22]|nr:hypothetical protein D7X33_22535 [Butyricicoccus sp. 1XD8-22]